MPVQSFGLISLRADSVAQTRYTYFVSFLALLFIVFIVIWDLFLMKRVEAWCKRCIGSLLGVTVVETSGYKTTWGVVGPGSGLKDALVKFLFFIFWFLFIFAPPFIMVGVPLLGYAWRYGFPK